MKPSELKYYTQNTEPYFFSSKTMRFFGDTMRNYGVCSDVLDGVDVWVLYRKNPVKHGLQDSAYFCKATLKRIFKKR